MTVNVPPLTIDPARQFGRVCINGTRIPASAVAWSVWAENDPKGNSGHQKGVKGCASDYGVTRNEALLACWWLVAEGHLVEVRGETKRKAKWVAWSDHALRVFGGWDKRTRKLCDPDDYEVAP